MRRLSPGVLAVAAVCGCPALKDAPGDGPAADAGGGGATDTGAEDAAAPDDAPDGGSLPGYATYDDAQAALEAKRFPGPRTAQGSTAQCTGSHFVWRDSDGTLHAWSGATQKTTDYGFAASQPRSFFVASDSFVVVDQPPTFAEIAVYRTDQPASLVTNLPYAFNFAAGDGAVIRADQSIQGISLGGTKVRRWNASVGGTEDSSEILPTKQPPAAFAEDQLVIPGDGPIPHPLYIVDVAKKKTTSVTFDGAVAMRQVLPTSHGLLVSYARTGGTSALRLYRGNQDAPASRSELGDELASRPGLFPDSPANEHRLLSRIATFGGLLVYDSAFGLWAYDLTRGDLAPLQLGPNKTALVTDVMCVMKDRGLLVYRTIPDPIGQVWVVPLSAAAR